MRFLVFFPIWIALAAHAQARGIEFSDSSDPAILHILTETIGYKITGDALISSQDVNGDGKNELFFKDENQECIEHLCATYLLQRQGERWTKIWKGMTNGDIWLSHKTDDKYHRIGMRMLGDPHLFNPNMAEYTWNGEEYSEASFQLLEKVTFKTYRLDETLSAPAAIKAFLESEYAPTLQEVKGTSSSAQVSYAEVDVDGDGKSEVITVLRSATHCGARGSCGCAIYRLDKQPASYLETKDFQCDTDSLYLMEEQDNGYRRITYQNSH